MRRLGVLMAVAIAGFAACEPADTAPEPAVRDTTAAVPDRPAAEERIEVQLMDSTGQQVGVSHLSQQGDGVEVHIRVSNLEPGSEHGVHFHENGTCEPPTFESAGGHFNPTGMQHGLENPRGPHVGDMPNIRAGEDGVADTTFVKPNTLLRGDSTSLQRSGGISLVVHADPDDMRTDPSGNSGSRIACGVVRVQ
ncbi:MAG TPA: superoxide dismutase family protein [Longimicrobiales bacterium]|nr:superoxide dismutase family protein [Longimicrobiales bacterium]